MNDDLMDNFITGWIARAIVEHNPRITVAIANSKPYRVKQIDRALDTIPLMDKPVISLN